MAEGRMLKKAISTSRRLADLKTDSARMLYTWIIPHLDIEGRFYADPSMIKGSVVPRIRDFNEKKIQECLTDMASVGLITLYNVDGDDYLYLRKFEKHQTLNPRREAASKIPSPVHKRRCFKKTTLERLWSEWEMSDKRCPVCKKQSLFVPGKGEVIDGYIKLHIDHIVPLSKGGTDDDENLRIVCAKCNLSKGNLMDECLMDDDDSRQTPENSGPTPDKLQSSPAQDKIREDKISKYICASNHPTIEQVKAYCSERKNNVDPNVWLDHYTSNGWMVGRNKMKDWKAAVRTWERTGFERGNGKRQATQPQQRDPFVMCAKCGEEYMETDIIDVNGSFYCPKCPEAKAAYSGGGDKVKALVSGIGGRAP